MSYMVKTAFYYLTRANRSLKKQPQGLQKPLPPGPRNHTYSYEEQPFKSSVSVPFLLSIIFIAIFIFTIRCLLSMEQSAQFLASQHSLIAPLLTSITNTKLLIEFKDLLNLCDPQVVFTCIRPELRLNPSGTVHKTNVAKLSPNQF